jgi:hypothetical protein
MGIEKELTFKEADELLQIDKFSLDKMCQTQVELFSKISNTYTFKISERDMDKESLAVIDAFLASEYRQDAEDLGEKVTEAKLNQRVQISKRHKGAFQKYIDSKLIADRWGILKEAFIQRASMIKHLCELQLSNYFADVEVKGNVKTEEVTNRGLRKRIRSSRE